MYDVNIGLEVHCQLNTNTKMFSNAPVTFNEEVNSKANEVDLSMIGILPTVNQKAIESALKVCHVLNLKIDELIRFDRKNYYYSDLPKGYQITQQFHPIGREGYLDIEVDNNIKRIEIERLHLEEDTAKQIHNDDYTLIDYNRAGIPLIEIVTKPVISNGKEASLYLEKLRQVLLYTNVSEANMSKGTLRVDVNISLKKKNTDKLGTKCEIKNLNSISNVAKAIDYEIKRQTQILDSNKIIRQETRRYDENHKQTVLLRIKEDAIDYKYFSEPNILPIRLDHEYVNMIIHDIPMMIDERYDLYVNKYHLSKENAHVLVYNKELSDYYNEVIKNTDNYILASNIIISDLLAYLNENGINVSELAVMPYSVATLVNEVDSDRISINIAKQVLIEMLENNKEPIDIIKEKHLYQISDIEELTNIINKVLEDNPKSINDYINGKNKAKGYLLGQVMRVTKGRANGKKTNEILDNILKNTMVVK